MLGPWRPRLPQRSGVPLVGDPAQLRAAASCQRDLRSGPGGYRRRLSCLPSRRQRHAVRPAQRQQLLIPGRGWTLASGRGIVAAPALGHARAPS